MMINVSDLCRLGAIFVHKTQHHKNFIEIFEKSLNICAKKCINRVFHKNYGVLYEYTII